MPINPVAVLKVSTGMASGYALAMFFAPGLAYKVSNRQRTKPLGVPTRAVLVVMGPLVVVLDVPNLVIVRRVGEGIV